MHSSRCWPRQAVPSVAAAARRPCSWASCCSARGTPCRVTGTDLDLTIQVTDEVIGIDDGSCVIPARLSTDIVRRLEPGAVTLADEGDHITISAARSTFKLQTYPVVEFPPVGKTSEPTTQLSEAGAGRSGAPGGARGVARRRPAAAHRCPGLAGRRVDPHGGHRLVPHGHAGPARGRHHPGRGGPVGAGPGPLGAPAPAGADHHRRGRDRPGRRGRERNEITFWQGNVQISTRLLEGRYPDYKQLIPDHYPNRLHLGKENFLAALRRVQLLVRDNTTPVRLSMRRGGWT